MKLGLIIKNTSGGEQEALAINKDINWSRYLDDVRPYIKELSNFDGSGKVVYLLKFLGKNGLLISVIKARPEGSGRAYDNTAAWIHIPSLADIKADYISKAINIVEESISAKYGIDNYSLNSFFSNEISSKDLLYTPLFQIISNPSRAIGYKLFGKGTDYNDIKELLDEALKMYDYKDYKGIFFIDKSFNITVQNIRETKILNSKKIIKILPPEAKDSFNPFIQNLEFNKAIEVIEGTKLDVLWKRNGYRDILKSVSVSNFHNGIFPKELNFNDSDKYLIISKSIFAIYNEEGEKINDCSIYINRTPFIENSTALPEADKNKEVEIIIEKPGYDRFSTRTKINTKIPIKLKKKIFHYEFKINAYDKDKKIPIKFAIETKHELNKSPIRGYVCEDEIYQGEGENNYLHFDDDKNFIKNIKKYAFGFLTCLGIFLISFLIMYFTIGDFQFKDRDFTSINNTTPTDTTEKNNTFDQYASKELAIKYLNNSTNWNKDSIDKYPDINGLFEDLNEYKFDKIINWANKLEDVNLFNEIIVLAKRAQNAGIKTYKKNNKDGEYTIDIIKYINNIKNIISLSDNNTTTPKTNATPKKNNTSKTNTDESHEEHPRGVKIKTKKDK